MLAAAAKWSGNRRNSLSELWPAIYSIFLARINKRRTLWLLKRVLECAKMNLDIYKFISLKDTHIYYAQCVICPPNGTAGDWHLEMPPCVNCAPYLDVRFGCTIWV